MQIRIRRRYELTVQPDLAVGGFLKKIHTPEQCGLAASGRPYYSNLLALFDRGGKALQNLKRAEILIYVLYLYHRLTYIFSRRKVAFISVDHLRASSFPQTL